MVHKLGDAEAAFTAMKPHLLEIDPEVVVPLKGDGQLAAIAALGVAMMIEQPDVKPRFEAVVSIGELDRTHFDRLLPASLALWYARHRQTLAAGVVSTAKLPAELDARSKTLRDRMFECGEYHLKDHPTERPVIDAIRPGVGYLDRSNDLMGLASVYGRNTGTLSKDPKHWRATDEAEARRTAVEILVHLGLTPAPGGDDWMDLAQRAWKLVSLCYEEVAPVGRMLFRHDDPEGLFPNLVASSRSARGPAKPDAAKPDPTKPA